MKKHKGFVAHKGANGWWSVYAPNGALCIQTGGTWREVQQAIDDFIRRRKAAASPPATNPMPHEENDARI